MRRGIIVALFTIFLLPAAGAASTTVQLSAPSGQACPTESAEYRVHVTNAADIEQQYTVSTDFPGATVAPEHLSIAAGASDSAYLWLQVPEDMQPGTYTFTVDVRSDTLEQTRTVDGTLDVLSCRAVTVDIADPAANICRGDTATYDVTATNAGNTEETYALAASSGTLSRDDVTLGPGGSTTLTLTRSSMDAVTEAITITASSTASYAADTEEVSFTAEQCRDASLHLSPDTDTVCEDGTGRFTATVTNTGSIPDTYHVAVNRPDITSRSITLAPNASMTIPIHTADRVGDHPVAVRVQSQGYAPLTRARDATLTVEDCYNLSVTAPTTRTLSLDATNRTLLTTRLTNTGTAENRYVLNTAGPDWIRVRPRAVTLEPGASTPAYVYVAPDYFSDGDYRSQFTVADTGGGVARSMDVNVTVGDGTVTARTGGGIGLTGNIVASGSGVVGIVVVAAILFLLYAFTVRNSVRATDASREQRPVPEPPTEHHDTSRQQRSDRNGQYQY